MSQNKISVIIPTFNTGNYLIDAIKSIEVQTYQNYELIIINDGSTDNTKQILKNYSFKDITKIKIIHQENKGVSFARNKGIEMSSGDFICFLDADDLYHPCFFEKSLAAHFSHQENAATCSNWIEKNKKTQRNKITYSDAPIIGYLNEWYSLSTLMIKSSIFKNSNLKFDVTLAISEDILFTVELLFLSSNVIYINDFLFVYRVRSDSAVHSSKTLSFYKKDLSGWGKTYYFCVNNKLNAEADRCLLKILGLHLNAMKYLLVECSFDDVISYRLENNVMKYKHILNNDFATKSDKRLFHFLTSNSKITLCVGYIYYKWIR